MAYAWSAPKTDWATTDFINYTDYERIRNNIGYIYQMASELYYGMDDLATMATKTGYSAYPYASEWNALESNLHMIFNSINTVSTIGEQKTFYTNGTSLDATELNRIESATLAMYATMTSQQNCKPRLAFTLNGGTIQP